jgi:hypothetical protein
MEEGVDKRCSGEKWEDLVSERTFKKVKEVESSHIIPLLLKFDNVCSVPPSAFNDA